MKTFMGRDSYDWAGFGLLCLVLGSMVAVMLSCEPVQAQDGYASYYTVASCKREGTSGVYTASGEPYIEQAMTCALPVKPDNRIYSVYGVVCQKTVYVRHNDRGPGKRPQAKGVIIDLTPEAFRQVCGSLEQGKCEVSIQGVL